MELIGITMKIFCYGSFLGFWGLFRAILGFRGPRISQLDHTYHEKVPLVIIIKKRYASLDLIGINCKYFVIDYFQGILGSF